MLCGAGKGLQSGKDEVRCGGDVAGELERRLARLDTAPVAAQTAALCASALCRCGLRRSRVVDDVNGCGDSEIVIQSVWLWRWHNRC
jgi:hypothetical protein